MEHRLLDFPQHEIPDEALLWSVMNLTACGASHVSPSWKLPKIQTVTRRSHTL